MSDPSEPRPHNDGRLLDPGRLADPAAVEHLVTAHAQSVDDRDCVRWQGLFMPHAVIDYISAGCIVGTPTELAAWMPAGLLRLPREG